MDPFQACLSIFFCAFNLPATSPNEALSLSELQMEDILYVFILFS